MFPLKTSRLGVLGALKESDYQVRLLQLPGSDFGPKLSERNVCTIAGAIFDWLSIYYYYLKYLVHDTTYSYYSTTTTTCLLYTSPSPRD